MDANVLNRFNQPDATGDNVYEGEGTNKINRLILGGTATNASALVLSLGSSSAKYAMGATADKYVAGIFAESTATTGDARVLNNRLYFSGAGGSGDVHRAYGIVNNVTAATGGTVNGIHATLAVTGASGAVSGAGNAIRAQLELGAGTTPGGTLSAIQLDSFFDNTTTVPTSAACLRVTNTGTKLWDKLINMPAPANGSIFAAHTTQTMTHSIKIISDAGTLYYIMCTNAATNRS